MAHMGTLADFHVAGRPAHEVVIGFIAGTSITTLVPGLIYMAIFSLFGVVGGVTAWLCWLGLRNRHFPAKGRVRWAITAAALWVPAVFTVIRLQDDRPSLEFDATLFLATMGASLAIAHLALGQLQRQVP